jgi:hypothetical protein
VVVAVAQAAVQDLKVLLVVLVQVTKATLVAQDT